MKTVLTKLLKEASKAMKAPTQKMKVERKILCEQYGLIWYGGIMTFTHLGLVSKMGEKTYSWGANKYFLTNQFATLDSFVDKFMRYAVEHPSPKQGCSLNNVFDYSTK